MYDNKQCLGKNADYSLNPVKQKSVNLYVENQPLGAIDYSMFKELEKGLPKGMQYGVRIRTWSQWYPNVPFLGTMIGYDLYNDQGEKLEVLATYLEFDVNSVPWEEVVS